jgi:hypothetical protein
LASYHHGWDDPVSSGAPEVPALFIHKLREKAASWQALGVRKQDTQVGYLDGRVWATVALSAEYSDGSRVSIGAFRADVSSTEWRRAFVKAGCHWIWQPSFEDADPVDRVSGSITDPQRDLDEITEWLRTRLELWARKGTPVPRMPVHRK